MGPGLGGFDKEIFADPVWMKAAMTGFAQMFTHGLEGYADDRIADGSGWVDFDVARIVCPVSVLHGTADRMVDVIHARHTANIVPGAELVVVEGHGHFSIERLIISELVRLLR
jgi:pimeloyl-ACP methyl ester carboxylesterase